MISVRQYPNKPVFVFKCFLFLHETSDIEKFKGRSHTFIRVRGSGGGRGAQIKKMVKIKTEVDGYTGGEGGRFTEIGCPEL